jgi:hypothetical protein
MARVARALLLAAVTFCLVAPSASAAPTNLGKTLGKLWTTVLETPTPDNPFGGGDGCVVLGGKIVAPLKPAGGSFTCTVKAGTRIFIAGWTTECSTFEGNGTTEAGLRACAVGADAGITATDTINGEPVPLSSVETGLLTIHLPQDNIFDDLKGADRNGLSVAHGLVYLTDPLTPGTYIIEGHVVFPNGSTADFTTTIIVQ